MKATTIKKATAALGLTGIIVLSASMNAWAGENPTVVRTKAWDGIVQTLGGIPDKVLKIEYAGSVFYLGDGVTENDFLAVLAVGSEAVRLHTAVNNGRLYIVYRLFVLQP